MGCKFDKIKKMNLFTWFHHHKLKFGIFAVILSLIFMVIGGLTSSLLISPIFWGLAFAIGGFAKAVEGVTKTIQEKSLNVEFLMIAASLAAFLTGEYAEGAVLIFIFAVSGVLEEFATAQTEKALTSLLKIAPKTAIKIVNDVEQVVEISKLLVRDIVVVKPGQQIPADGVIIKGGAAIDQSSITGEFNPSEKLMGDQVFAGSIVINAPILVQVTKDPQQSVVQKMIQLIKRAQEEKTRSEKRVSLFEKIYVYVVIALSLFVIFLTPPLGWLTESEAFRRGIIVLVVASPCALVASITPALLSTLSHAAKKGILIKSGRYIESLRYINVVAFDKTGTLTTGKPKVVEYVFETKVDELRLLPTMVAAEKLSNHPLAKAISLHFKDVKNIAVELKEIPGRGLEVKTKTDAIQVGNFPFKATATLEEKFIKAGREGKTLVNIIENGVLKGFIALEDSLREDSKVAIEQLKQLSIQPVMLTGDKKETALAIAQKMGIQTIHAESLPETKVTVVQTYASQGKKVLMIGDGINDAPALATASIGVSMGDGTDVSLETADIVMMNNQLQNIPYLIKLSYATQNIITQNVVFSIAVILVLLISNLFGIVVLRYGVIGHELSTILVILNSLRLLSSKKKPLRI
jgi:Cd2+/Zn2+-exporting ATPase